MQLLGVDGAEYLRRDSVVRLRDDPGALDQSRSEHLMVQIAPRLLRRRDGEPSRRRALTQAGDLREHEPHPVARLVSSRSSPMARFVDPTIVLGDDETLEVKGIVVSHHFHRMAGDSAESPLHQIVGAKRKRPGPIGAEDLPVARLGR